DVSEPVPPQAPLLLENQETAQTETDAAEDLSRLMAEADTQMQDPGGATRRSAFDHLRAAVAARFADKTMRDTTLEETVAQPYRKDLAQAVKPRRPVASGSRARPRRSSELAPLRLDAEQRVDTGNLRKSRPLRQNLAAANHADDTVPASDSGFPGFAQNVDATTLPELVEAAAAYLGFVEDRVDFSRPELMANVRQAHPGDFDRENELRAFGQLLRSGKIERIEGGRFRAADSIGFQPDERAAG
ncbi:MAG: hypothetical protein ABJH13_02880, partial [Roseobacter sp.]